MGKGASTESADGELGVEGREREVVDGRGFAGYAVVVHGVDAVGGDVHLKDVAVVWTEMRGHLRRRCRAG